MPPVGSLAWEELGGPPLSVAQRVGLLAGTAAVLARDTGPRLRWRLRGATSGPRQPAVDLSAWAPPTTQAARAAEDHLRTVASPQMIAHSMRTYWFTAVEYELSKDPAPPDREAIWVAALMHDTGLFDPDRDGCFTVAGARQARRIMTDAGWPQERQDAVALAITTNLNPRVSARRYGSVAHHLRAGGIVDVMAKEWELHPDNLREILAAHPRDGFADDTAALVRAESTRNPGCRFACFGPIFPTVVRWSTFSTER